MVNRVAVSWRDYDPRGPVGVSEVLAEISAWWARGNNRGHYERMFQIAGSPHDQLVPDGTDNPYWEIVRHLPSTADLWDGVTPYSYPDGLEAGRRETFTKRYSWSIPSPGDIAWLRRTLDGSGLVEIGAGAGYWAWQARQAGIDVVAYEPQHPSANHHVDGPAYTELLRGDHEAAALHPDRALLICWPTYSAPWASEALSAYKGDTLVYIGEGPCHLVGRSLQNDGLPAEGGVTWDSSGAIAETRNRLHPNRTCTSKPETACGRRPPTIRVWPRC